MENIKNIRQEAKLRQEDVANIIGIKRATYASYETQRDTIPINHLNNLCNYFNISIDYALGLSNELKYKNSRQEINQELFKIRIKQLRKNNNLTQNKISSILNISRSTWTNYEYCKFQITTLIIYDIAKKYNSSIDYLLGKIDENPRRMK